MSFDPKEIANFPVDDTSLKIFKKGEHIYVVRRHYFWDPEKKRGLENREYVGKIVDGCYYSMEEFRRNFKRTGEPRAFTKKGPIKSRARKKTEQQTSIITNDKAEPVTKKQSPQQENTNKVNFVDAKQCGEVLVFDKLAEQIQLREDLIKVFDEKTANALLSVAYYYITERRNASYLYHYWKDRTCAPCPTNMSGKDLTELFASIGSDESKIHEFFKARIARLDGDETFSYDATNIACESQNIEDAQLGKGKDGSYRKQISLSLLFAHKRGLPVAFRTFPGNITDVSTVSDFLMRFDDIGVQASTAVLDRGYFSKKNICRLVLDGRNVIIASKNNSEWISNAIDQVLPELEQSKNRVDKGIYATTVKTTLEDDTSQKFTAYVHVYCDKFRRLCDTEDFLETLESFERGWELCRNEKDANHLLNNTLLEWYETPQSKPGNGRLTRNSKAIDEQLKMFGIFTNVTTMECSASYALSSYRNRDCIEKSFKLGKSEFEMDTSRSHSSETLLARLFVSYLALILSCELNNRMKSNESVEIKNGSLLTLNNSFASSADLLGAIASIRGCAGYMSEVTQRQKNIAKRLGMEGVFDQFPAHLS